MTITDTMLNLMQWILGAIGALLILLFGFWWKVESRQDHKIDKLNEDNQRAHLRLHQRIDETKDELKNDLAKHHNVIRDKIELILARIGGHRND